MVGGCFYKITHGRRLRSGLIVSGGLFTTTQTGDNDTDKRRLGRPASTQMTGNTEGRRLRRTTTRTVSYFGVLPKSFKHNCSESKRLISASQSVEG